MHLRPDGRPATGDLSANAWQSRQGMPYLPAWIVWSNGTSPAVPAPAGVAAGAGACVCGWALDTTRPPTIAAAAKATRDLVRARATMTQLQNVMVAVAAPPATSTGNFLSLSGFLSFFEKTLRT